MSQCEKYPSYSKRVKRCIELGICSICSSFKHLKDECPAPEKGLSRPCFHCQSKGHIDPLCPSSNRTSGAATPRSRSNSNTEEGPLDQVKNDLHYLSMSAGNDLSDQILPTMTLKVRKGKKTVPVRILLDLGSQRTYFHSNVLKNLGVDSKSFMTVRNTVKTFIGEEERIMSSLPLD